MAALTPRGYRGPGGGRVSYVEAPPEWRATTVQACGLFPWAVGGGTPTLGVPIGRHLRAGTTVCFDVINWFERGQFLPNPSYFCLGLPGLGKSTFTRRQVLGLSAQGVRPLVLGDLKPDYADLIAAIGGQVVKLGRGLGSLNVLDVGAIEQAACQLGGADADRLRAEAHGRRLAVLSGLILIVRGTPIADYERAVLSAALRVLLARHDTTTSGPPTLPDLVRVLDHGPPEVRAVTLDRGQDDRYRASVDPLHRSLLALLDGPLGDTFSRPTTTRIALDSPGVAIDVSGNPVPTLTCRPPCCWRAGPTGSGRWSPRTPWPMPGPPRNAGSSSCSTSCGGSCAPASGWSTTSTPSPGSTAPKASGWPRSPTP